MGNVLFSICPTSLPHHSKSGHVLKGKVMLLLLYTEIAPFSLWGSVYSLYRPQAPEVPIYADMSKHTGAKVGHSAL